MTTKERGKKVGANQRYVFARHETFHLRDGWLFKALNILQEDPAALYQPEAHHHLGVGINMMRSIVYWVQATNLAQQQPGQQAGRRSLQLTEYGQLILTHDPFLEDDATLWLLHLHLASNRYGASFWYWAFNEFRLREFTEEGLLQEIQAFLVERGVEKFSESSLKKDVRCFRRTYLPADSTDRSQFAEDSLDCPLDTLGLLRASALPGRYRFQVGPHRNLPLLIFAYALFRFRELTVPEQVVASLDDLRWAPLSPGRLLCLDTSSLAESLEELQRQTGLVSLVRTAGLNTVHLKQDRRSVDFLNDYYTEAGL